MTPVVVGRDEEDLRARAARTAVFRGWTRRSSSTIRPKAGSSGRSSRSAEQLRELEQRRCQQSAVPALPHDDLEFVEILGRELAPLVA